MAILRSKVLWTGLALLASYWLLIRFIPQAVAGEVVSDIRASLAILCAVLFAPLALKGLASRRFSPADHFAVGVSLGWAAVGAVTILGSLGRQFGFVTAPTVNALSGFFVWGSIWAVVMHATAVLEKRQWWIIGAAALAGLLLSAFLLSL